VRTHAHALGQAVPLLAAAAHTEGTVLVLLERREEHHALEQTTPQHTAAMAGLVKLMAAHRGGAAAAGALRLEAVREAVTAKAKATAETTVVVQAPERAHHAEVTARTVEAMEGWVVETAATYINRARVPHALGKRRVGRTRRAETEATEEAGSAVAVVLAHQGAHHHTLEQLAPATAAARLSVRLGLGLGLGRSLVLGLLVLVGGLALRSGSALSAVLPVLLTGRLERGLAGKPRLAPRGLGSLAVGFLGALAVALESGRRDTGCGSDDKTERLLSLLGEVQSLDQLNIAGHGDEVVLIVDVPNLELGRVNVVALAQQALELSEVHALAQSETAEVTGEVTLHDNRHRS